MPAARPPRTRGAAHGARGWSGPGACARSGWWSAPHRRSGRASWRRSLPPPAAMISGMDHFRATNLECWEERADVHAASPDYDVDLLATDPDLLSEVVRFDRPASATSRGSTSCTSSATSAPTRSRWPGSARRSPGSTSRRARWPRRGTWRPGPASTSASSSRSCTARPPRSGPPTTWSTRASGRSTGSPTSRAGPRWSPRCCARVAGCTSARATPCCGRSRTRVRTACCRSSTPTSRSPSHPCSTSPAPTWRPTTSSCTTGPTSGTTAWARSSPHCSTPGSR